MVYVRGEVCGVQQQMYRVSVIRDGGARGIAGMSVCDSNWCVYGIVVLCAFSRV